MLSPFLLCAAQTSVPTLSVSADIDGDGTPEKVVQDLYSRRDQKRITSYPSDFDKRKRLLSTRDAVVRLYVEGRKGDTLSFEQAEGLYCLLNVGDTNADGTDELALVVDWTDDTNLNSCRIQALCSGRWTLLSHFSIHESSFEWEKGRKQPIFAEIRGYLGKYADGWYFRDAMVEMETGDPAPMQPLRTEKCKP